MRGMERQILLRLNSEEGKALDELVKKSGVNQSDAIRGSLLQQSSSGQQFLLAEVEQARRLAEEAQAQLKDAQEELDGLKKTLDKQKDKLNFMNKSRFDSDEVKDAVRRRGE